jgi:hypothetical protein
MTHRGPSPAPEQELALLAIGTRASRSRLHDRMLGLVDVADFDALERWLRARGTLSLVGPRLRELCPRLPAHFVEQIERYTALAQRQGVAQQMLTIRLVAALEERGIKVLPIKGPLLGERLYGQAGARVSADIDLLVAAPDLPGAVEVISALGYTRARSGASGPHALPTLHERLVSVTGLPDVELHWRVHWYERHFSADMLARSAPGDGCLQPLLVDELAELLLLYARDGFAGIRLLADVAAWWDRYGERLDPGDIEALVSAYPAVARTLATAALLAERLAGLPARELLSASRLAEASGWAVRLCNWPLRGEQGQIEANVTLVDWILAPGRQRRALVRRHLLLSREDLLTRWPEVDAGGLGTLRLRALHLLRVIGRYAIAGWQLRQRGSWAPIPRSLEVANAD